MYWLFIIYNVIRCCATVDYLLASAKNLRWKNISVAVTFPVCLATPAPIVIAFLPNLRFLHICYVDYYDYDLISLCVAFISPGRAIMGEIIK